MVTKAEELSNLSKKPATLPVLTENIPEYLKTLRWVCWRWKKTDGKGGTRRWSKVPIIPGTTWKPARTNDPTTWRSYEEAVVWYEVQHNIGNINGIGVVLTGDLCGLDLDDHCDDRHELVGTFGTYAERSPTGGFGYKVFARGVCPGPDHHGGGCEIYDHRSPRWFAVTGHRVDGCPADVRPCQVAIDRFYDAKIRKPDVPKPERSRQTDSRPERPRAQAGEPDLTPEDGEVVRVASLTSDRFRHLWAGDSGPNHSEADAALVALLGHYVGGDPDRVDTLFRESGLMRDKWERTSYRTRTLTKYADPGRYFDWGGWEHAKRHDPYTVVPEWPTEDGRGAEQDTDDSWDLTGTYDGLEMLRRSRESRTDHLFDGLVETGVITLFCGLPYSGKSLVVLQLVRALATGREFYGRACRMPATPVLYINADRLRDRQFHRRLSAVCEDDAELMGLLPLIQFTEVNDLPATVTTDYLGRLIRGMKRRHRADTVLVVIDTMRPAFLMEQGPGSENDPGVMTKLLGPVRALAGAENCPVMLLHHNNRGQNTYAGSAAIAGTTEAVWTVTKHDHTATIDVESRDAGSARLVVTLGPKPESAPVTDPLHDRIMRFPTAEADAVTREQAAEWFPDMRETAFRDFLAAAQRAGVHPRLEQTGRGTRGSPYRYYRV